MSCEDLNVANLSDDELFEGVLIGIPEYVAEFDRREVAENPNIVPRPQNSSFGEHTDSMLLTYQIGEN